METPMRERILNFADVIMRVPALFIIDELLRISLGLPNNNTILDSIGTDLETTSVSDTIVSSISSVTANSNLSFLINQLVKSNRFPYKIYFIVILKFLSCCIGE